MSVDQIAVTACREFARQMQEAIDFDYSKNPVMLSPSLYYAAEKAGFDMRYYKPQELIPLTSRDGKETWRS